jgi:hypothetical protein
LPPGLWKEGSGRKSRRFGKTSGSFVPDQGRGDFPEEEIEEIGKTDLEAKLREAERELSLLEDSFAAGRIIREGVKP